MSTARAWFKSSCGGDEGGACVEAAAHPAAVLVRDSRNPEGPALALPPAAWAGFTAHVGR
ncbi:DUF397 domain-containing protein [Streptomyces sp. JV185]|uniref:DUF397 domain-containing protein n=1 Tax=Streptomyces sp. JV185 TaxID=858638 RepID=UPI002E76B6D4|nr:DUF397 domain-containing protein [Streptomyces sp. JV185]MEE1773821.1 DUF397 domain-containing protein [Streptomyces sp. JV185]